MLQLTVSDDVFLDFMLMKIRSRTIAYAAMKKKKTREKQETIWREIQLIEQKENKTEMDVKNIGEKGELVLLRETTMLTRSKARWVVEGKKIAKYFCNLKQINYFSK